MPVALGNALLKPWCAALDVKISVHQVAKSGTGRCSWWDGSTKEKVATVENKEACRRA